MKTPFLVVAVATALLCLGCDRSTPAPLQTAAATAPDPVIQVTTVRAHRGAISRRLSAPGSVVARRESHIGAEVRAEIQKIYVSEGDRVQAGDLLFQLDPSAYEMALRQAEAGLDVARAERGQLESDLARARTLRRQNVLSAQDIERVTTSLEVAKARERQAEEGVSLSRHNLEQTSVRAPYAGSVAARLADEGTTALVQPQTIVVVLQETQELEARAVIPESQLALVRVGDRALVHVEGLPDPIETTVSAVSDTIDPATRTYLVKMRIPNEDYRLKAGVFTHIEILPQAKEDVVLVPRGSVRTEDGRTRVMAVKDGRVQAVPVEIGVVSDDEAEVLRGVDPGTEILVGEAAHTIAPGMRVEVVGEGESS